MLRSRSWNFEVSNFVLEAWVSDTVAKHQDRCDSNSDYAQWLFADILWNSLKFHCHEPDFMTRNDHGFV